MEKHALAQFPTIFVVLHSLEPVRASPELTIELWHIIGMVIFAFAMPKVIVPAPLIFFRPVLIKGSAESIFLTTVIIALEHSLTVVKKLDALTLQFIIKPNTRVLIHALRVILCPKAIPHLIKKFTFVYNG
jgi:hypothetical protein